MDNFYKLFFQDAEFAVEAEKNRVASVMGELTLTKSEIEKRLAEKDEELEGLKYVRFLFIL